MTVTTRQNTPDKVPLYDQAALDDVKADRDMLREALAGLVSVVECWPGDLSAKSWHALEDARQALAQAGGPNGALTAQPKAVAR
jgi:hypothetical protein